MAYAVHAAFCRSGGQPRIVFYFTATRKSCGAQPRRPARSRRYVAKVDVIMVGSRMLPEIFRSNSGSGLGGEAWSMDALALGWGLGGTIRKVCVCVCVCVRVPVFLWSKRCELRAESAVCGNNKG